MTYEYIDDKMDEDVIKNIIENRLCYFIYSVRDINNPVFSMDIATMWNDIKNKKKT